MATVFVGRCLGFTALLLAALMSMPAVTVAEEEETPSLVQCKDKPANPTRAKHLAGDMFGRAERAFNERQYPKALRRFLCSLYVIEHEATVANIEKVLPEIDNPGLALKILDDYIALNPEGSQTPRISAMAEAIREKIAAEAARTGPQRCPEQTEGAAQKRVCVSYPDTALVLDEGRGTQAWMKAMAIGMLGVGGAAIVAGGVLQGVSISAHNRGRAATSEDTRSDATERGQKLQVAAIAAWTAGAVTAGLGAAQLFAAVKRRARLDALEAEAPTKQKCSRGKGTDRVAPEVSVGPGGVSVSVRF